MKALQLLSVMLQDQVKADTITFNAAISACEGEWRVGESDRTSQAMAQKKVERYVLLRVTPR